MPINQWLPYRIVPTLICICLLTLTACNRQPSPTEPRALTPAEALKSFQLSEEFNVELFLSEPQVQSPVEMVWDENGRIYVAEMLDYPDDPPPGKPARSRIRLLEDNDGDGKYERVVVFADQVLQVSGLLPWREGLLVTSAPDILWLKDIDGDGRADTRKVLYTGFPKVNPEARITNLRYGLDNWIYAANHGNNGKITSPGPPASRADREPLLIRGGDFRFHPVRDRAERSSGPAQFGLTFDEWGNQFITENTAHLRHVVLPMHYLARAPLLDAPGQARDISDHGKPSAPMFPLTGPQQWRIERTKLRQERYDENNLKRTEHVGGYFSAASGGTVYTGDVFPAEYVNNVFTGDVSGNLVHRDVIKPDGVSFSAARSQDKTEFLASTDQWFRPCNFANAPDGNLYLLDVYRLFIETPESIPEEIKKGMDFYAGDTLGRIYRFTPKSPLRKRDLQPRLGKASAAELVKLLAETNGWHRLTAQRLLVERQDKSTVPLLKQLAAQSKSPLGRMHALWTLEGLSSLDETLVRQALQDTDAHVREQALRLAEGFLPRSKQMAGAVTTLANDADTRVQFQAAFTLGQVKDARALDALAAMALQRGSDQWFRAAMLSSVNDEAARFFQLLGAQNPTWENKELLAQLSALIGAKHDVGEIARFVPALAKRPQPEAGLTGLAKGLKLANVRSLRVPGIEAALTPLLNGTNDAVQKAAWEVARYFELRALVQRAMADAATTNLPPHKRVIAVRALRGGQYAAVAPVLRKLLEANETAELQTAAIETLASFDDAQIAATLLGAWPKFTPEIRGPALNALLGNQVWMKTLLEALEQGRIERHALDINQRARLLDHPDKAVADRAAVFFKPETDDRAQIVSSYFDALKLNGHVERGRQVFETNCAKCHLPQRERSRVGPDLSGISNKTKEELLASILNPSQAIEPRFVNYIVTTKDGRVHDGLLANETAGALTLRTADADTVILRTHIAELRQSRISLMPDGFEKQVSRQQLADLIAYLRGGL